VSNSDKDAEQADEAKDVCPIAGLCAIDCDFRMPRPSRNSNPRFLD
jgi:hypothetical protein